MSSFVFFSILRNLFYLISFLFLKSSFRYGPFRLHLHIKTEQHG